MFHRCLLHLAKTKGPTPRRLVLRRPLRRSGSGGSSVAGAARQSSATRTAARKGVHAKASGASASLSAARGKGGGGGGRGANGDSTTAMAIETTAAAEARDSDAAVPLTTHDGFSGVSADSAASSSASARRPLYRLATAVATVVVPPTTNVYLQGMKHILTPATPSPSVVFGGGGGPAVPSVSIVEEYYTSKKGPLFATAVVAGTNAVKQVSSLVPFCYPTPIQRCSFTFRRRQVLHPPRPAQMPHRVVLRRRTSEPGPQQRRPEYSVIYCFCTVATESKGGVEMEALTGATMAGITLYDMLKGLPGAQEDGLSLGEAFVLAKRGGRNDFTKLLMSEPDRPLVESGVRSVEAQVQALPSSSGVIGGAAEQSSTGATHPSQSAATGSEASRAATPDANRGAPTNAARARAEGEQTSEEVPDEEDHHPVAKRVIRRPAPAAAATAHGVCDDSAGPGDTDAWWRSSKHEKRLQELYPRRKYGDNARVVPTTTTPTPAGSPATRARARTSPLETPDSVAEVVAASAAHLAARPRLGPKSSAIREGRAFTAGKGPAAAVALGRAAGVTEPTESSEAVATDDVGDPEDHRRPATRRLVKRSTRAATPAVEADDDDYDEKSAAVAEEEELEDEEAAEATAANDADEAAEQEEAAMTASAKRRRRGAAVTAVSKGHATVAVTTAKPSLSGKHAQTVHRRYLAGFGREAKESDALGDDPAAAAEDEGAEDTAEEDEGEVEEEEERAPTKSNAAATARKAQAHVTVAGKRSGKSASELSSGGIGAGSRKQRPGRAASKKGRAQAELDDHHDSAVPEDDSDGTEKGDSEADAGDADAVSAAAAKRRGKAAAKQTRLAAPRKGGAMRSFQHDSWDAGPSWRSRRRNAEVNADEEYAESLEEEAEAFEEDDSGVEEEEVPPPPLPPRRQLRKPLKRASPKRR
ncbi:hypothetical protein LSCM1_03300 [Leishmania martiniquensis]|uniref:Molybdopterin cofactor biosynthesis C (MoaC) domain-containing protein n=1 Tax=Leishmania martiniquensis TaxID=1580590 RepID=A0A836KFP7_9TRYP|nr:hypothetical protein LSCM1_03300 [Leishmania martiniquensis]